MMESYNIQDVMAARIQDLEEMLGMCMELESKTGERGRKRRDGSFWRLEYA